MSLNLGDIVRLNREDAARTLIDHAEVIHVPRADTDPWGFRNLVTGEEVYSSEKFTAYVKQRAKATGESQ